ILTRDQNNNPSSARLIGIIRHEPKELQTGELLDTDRRPLARLVPGVLIQQLQQGVMQPIAFGSEHSKTSPFLTSGNPARVSLNDLEKSLHQFSPTTLQERMAKLILATLWTQYRMLQNRLPAGRLEPKESAALAIWLAGQPLARLNRIDGPGNNGLRQ